MLDDPLPSRYDPCHLQAHLSGKVDLKPFDSGTREVLSGLLEKNEFVRFGVDGGAKALKSTWFADVDWEKLVKRELPPPWVPDISDKLDLHHFDQYDRLRSSCRDLLVILRGATTFDATAFATHAVIALTHHCNGILVLLLLRLQLYLYHILVLRVSTKSLNQSAFHAACSPFEF